MVKRQEKHTGRNNQVLEKLSDAMARLAGVVKIQAEEAASSHKAAPRPAPFSILKRKKESNEA